VEENEGSVRAENRSGAPGAIFTLSAPLLAAETTA
jgi:hypothetical protein